MLPFLLLSLVSLCIGEVYDLSKGLFDARSDLSAAATGNIIMFAGGLKNSYYPAVYSSTVDIYDIDTGSYSFDQIGLSEARAYMASASLYPRLYFAGGLTSSGVRSAYSTKVDIYNIETKVWSRASLFVERANLAAAGLESYVLFGGGYKTNPLTNRFISCSIVDIYNVNTNKWTISNLSEARGALSAASAGKHILFAGGSSNFYRTNCSSTVDVFNTDTQTWSTSRLSIGRCDMASASTDQYIVFGGGSITTNVYSATVDVYDTNTNSWTVFENGLSIARSYVAAAAAGDYIVFGGGSAGTNLVKVIEILDLRTGTWIYKPNGLNKPRMYLAAAGTKDIVMFGGGISYQSERSTSVTVHKNQIRFNVNATACTQSVSYSYVFTSQDEIHEDQRCERCFNMMCAVAEFKKDSFGIFSYICSDDKPYVSVEHIDGTFGTVSISLMNQTGSAVFYNDKQCRLKIDASTDF